jgi:hypothetical protein
MAKPEQLDEETRHLVRLAAAIAQGYEPELRERAAECRAGQVPIAWVEELLLQSLLMVGYPRVLVAFAVWRKVGRVAAPPGDPEADYARVGEWTARGEETCGRVYTACAADSGSCVLSFAHFLANLCKVQEKRGI